MSVTFKAGWDLVSSLGYRADISNLLGGGEKSDKIIHIYKYDNTSNSYKQVDKTTILERGVAYWIKCKEDIIFAPPATSEASEASVTRALNTGWNMIATPFSQDTQKEDIFSSDDINKITHIYKYDYTSNIYTRINADDKLENGKGYWVYSKSSITMDDHRAAIYNLSYLESDSVLKGYVDKAKTILDSMIIGLGTNNTFNIDILLEDMEDGYLGQAWSYEGKYYIKLNAKTSGNDFIHDGIHTRGSPLPAGDYIVPKNVATLIHEILHVLGFGMGAKWNSLIDTDNSRYIGMEGVKKYKDVLNKNGFITTMIESYIPIENNGDAGTFQSHLEEGSLGPLSTPMPWTLEVIIYSKVMYPVIPRALMTGWGQPGMTFITDITLGILQDLGFIVNYNSSYVKNTNVEFFPNSDDTNSYNLSVTTPGEPGSP